MIRKVWIVLVSGTVLLAAYIFLEDRYDRRWITVRRFSRKNIKANKDV